MFYGCNIHGPKKRLLFAELDEIFQAGYFLKDSMK